MIALVFIFFVSQQPFSSSPVYLFDSVQTCMDGAANMSREFPFSDYKYGKDYVYSCSSTQVVHDNPT
jgi:hypothetical protein